MIVGVGPARGWLPGAPALLVAVCLAFMLAIAPHPASAHSTLLSSTPRPGEKLSTGPGVVVLTFSQPLDIRLSRATVIAPNGQRFDDTSVSPAEIRIVVSANAPGVYEVSWTSVSAVDGHTLSGGFRFGVNVSPSGLSQQAPLPGTGDITLAALRGLEYALLLLSVGMLLLIQLAALTPRLAWVRTWLPLALGASLAAGIAVVVGEALIASGGPSLDAVSSYLDSGPAGWTRLGRIAAEAVAVLVASRWPRLAAVPIGAALVCLAAAGHAAAVEPPALGVAVTVVHLASAGLWAGGILALALQRPPGGWLARDGRRLLARFTPVALAAFPVTAATGLLQGAEELTGLRDLLTSAYGQVLSAKSLAVLLMLPLSVLAWRRIRPSPRVEAGLALVVVAASALLAAFPLPPARFQEAQAAQAGPNAALALPTEGDLTMAASAGDVLIGLTLRPGKPGPNTAWLYVLPIGGEAAASGLHVTLTEEGRSRDVTRCGPACRSAPISVNGGETLAVGVDGRDGGTATFRVPALPAADAQSALDRAQQAMHALRTYRLNETLRPARVPLTVTYAFQAPDRLSYDVSGGGQTVIVGPVQYSRDRATGPWHAEAMPPVQVPDFVWDGSQVIAPRVIAPPGDESAPLQEVAFYENQEGVPVWFQLSIDARGLVEHASMRAQAHFMTHDYYDFDAPLTVVPPSS